SKRERPRSRRTTRSSNSSSSSCSSSGSYPRRRSRNRERRLFFSSGSEFLEKSKERARRPHRANKRRKSGQYGVAPLMRGDEKFSGQLGLQGVRVALSYFARDGRVYS